MKKNRLAAMSVFAMALLAASVSYAQNISDILTNVPTVSLLDEKVGVSTGPLMRGASTFANATMIDVNLGNNFFVGTEIDVQNASSSQQFIDALGVRFGLSRNLGASAKIYGYLEGRKRWDPNLFEGVLGGGIVYTPASSGGSFASHFSMGIEPLRIVINKELSKGGKPPIEQFAFIRYSF